MKIFSLLFAILYLFTCYNTIGQETIPITKAIILSVEDDKVYLDLGEGSINVGDRLQVIRDRGFFTHPVTGEQIARDPEIVGYIQVTDVRSNYSEGMVSPRSAIASLEAGMEGFLLEGEERDTREFRKSIAVQPLNVSSAVGGYLGIYIADMLTEELFNIDQFRVIDRQSLGWQMDEIALATQGVVDEKEAIRVGRTMGVDYFITGTMYEPDVVDVSTGVPLKGIVGAAEAISGVRLGSELVSDVRVSQLRAIVNLTLRVVDVETGEILFITSEMQQATGRSQVNLEQGALGGLQLQGGATSFLNTITGQATKAALINLTDYINGYFDGTIDVRNFRGNVIEIGRVGTRSEGREERYASVVSAEYIDKEVSSSQQSFSAVIDRGSRVGYRSNKRYHVYEPIIEESFITGDIHQTGLERIGKIKLSIVEDELSQGNITLNSGIDKPIDYTFSDAVIKIRGISPKFNHRVAYTAGIPTLPVGIKYIYARSFGFYTGFNTDFNTSATRVGGVVTVSQTIGAYLGLGIWWRGGIGWGNFDGGILINMGRLFIDLGYGWIGHTYNHTSRHYGTIGFGIGF